MTTRAPIDAVVLDYGEVLCHPADPAAMARMAIGAGLTPESFHDCYWRLREDYDRGILNGPSYWALVSQVLDLPWTPAQVASLVEQDVALWTKLEPRMIAWTEALLDRGAKVALLSNMVPEIGRHLVATVPLFERFSCVTFSCEVGSVKPEARIYEHVLHGLGVAPSRALLIDDRAVNIEGARAVGMQGVLFRGYDDLIGELDARYVIG